MNPNENRIGVPYRQAGDWLRTDRRDGKLLSVLVVDADDRTPVQREFDGPDGYNRRCPGCGKLHYHSEAYHKRGLQGGAR